MEEQEILNFSDTLNEVDLVVEPELDSDFQAMREWQIDRAIKQDL